MKHRIAAAAFALSTVIGAGSVFASEPVEQFNSSALWFENWGNLTNATLTIGAPDGNVISVSTETGTPVFQLQGHNLADGVYSYELSAATGEMEAVVNPIDNGRGDNSKDQINKPFHMSGYIVISRGVITANEDIDEDSE